MKWEFELNEDKNDGYECLCGECLIKLTNKRRVFILFNFSHKQENN